MKQSVSLGEFRDRFLSSDTYKDSFSYEGLTALYEYIEGYEREIGEEIDFDMVALCCEYSEYTSAWEAMKQYQPEDMPVCEDTGVDENGHGMDLMEIKEEEERMAIEWLEEHTQVIPVSNVGVIIQNF